jgi:hypothetical protein
LQSAIETLRNGGDDDPVKAAFNIAGFIEGLTAKRLERVQDAMSQLPAEEFDRVVESLNKAAQLHIKLAEFAFPKLADSRAGHHWHGR